MIEMELAHVDLARLRFAHSPIGEMVAPFARVPRTMARG
jgi:hypothetical protein